jgi:hypothetical protein
MGQCAWHHGSMCEERMMMRKLRHLKIDEPEVEMWI